MQQLLSHKGLSKIEIIIISLAQISNGILGQVIINYFTWTTRWKANTHVWYIAVLVLVNIISAAPA